MSSLILIILHITKGNCKQCLQGDSNIFRYSDYITNKEVLCKKFLHADRKQPTRTQQLIKQNIRRLELGAAAYNLDTRPLGFTPSLSM